MKPIQLNKHQIEALHYGATMLWMPIDEKYKLNGNGTATFRDEFDSLRWLEIHELSPLQIGQEYYVQEEVKTLHNTCFRNNQEMLDILFYLGYIPYSEDTESADWIVVQDKTLLFGGNSVNRKYRETKVTDGQIVYKSRSKFKPTNIQVKRSQDITHDEIYTIYPEAHEDGYDNFMHGFNEKYLDGKYEENPYGFLITIERIK